MSFDIYYANNFAKIQKDYEEILELYAKYRIYNRESNIQGFLYRLNNIDCAEYILKKMDFHQIYLDYFKIKEEDVRKYNIENDKDLQPLYGYLVSFHKYNMLYSFNTKEVYESDKFIFERLLSLSLLFQELKIKFKERFYKYRDFTIKLILDENKLLIKKYGDFEFIYKPHSLNYNEYKKIYAELENIKSLEL
jgi:hypothetical protein